MKLKSFVLLLVFLVGSLCLAADEYRDVGYGISNSLAIYTVGAHNGGPSTAYSNTMLFSTLASQKSGGSVGILMGCFSNSTTMADCHASGYVTCNSEAGLLCGQNDSGAISSSYSNVNICCASSNVGGLVGNNSSSSVLSFCYSTGSVNWGKFHPMFKEITR